jgi:hypothetical protein
LVIFVNNQWQREGRSSLARLAVRSFSDGRHRTHFLTSTARSSIANGPEWTRDFLVPTMRAMIEAMLPSEFETYAAGAERLKALVRLAVGQLEDVIGWYEESSVKSD